MFIDTSVIVNSLPNESVKALAQFNKITGAYTGLFKDTDLSLLNRDYFDYVSVTINPETQTIKGTYNNFQIVNRSEQPALAYEIAFDNAAQAKIDKIYSVYTRINMLENNIKKIMDNLNIKDEAFDEMLSFISEVRRTNEIIKQAVMEDPNVTYITRQKHQEILDEQLEGGLHEAIGPRLAEPDIMPKNLL